MRPITSTQQSPATPTGLADFIRLPAVMQLTGLARSTIYRMMAEQNFPDPVRLSKRAVGWRRADLETWSQSRPSVHD